MLSVILFPCELMSIMSGSYCLYVLVSSFFLVSQCRTLCCITVRLNVLV